MPNHRRWTIIITLTVLAFLVLGALPSATARAQAPEPGTVYIYLFEGDGCPRCAEEKIFLADLSRRYPQIEVNDFEVWYNRRNLDLLNKMAAAFGFQANSVPITFIGDRYWIGYSQDIGAGIEAYVADCVENGCPDAGAGIIPGREQSSEAKIAQAMQSGVITIPLIGEVNLKNQSLILSTAIIAFVDGFNPCSLWVLSILLAITLNAGSRPKTLIIGLIFLTVTSLVYVLFIAGLFTVLSLMSFVGWVQAVVALLALFFAAVNIKDYFWYKEGLSFTIADDKKPGIYKSIRRTMTAGSSFWGLVGATVAMSAGVSLVEFSCTAGFPVLWTNLLTAQQVTPLTFALLLLLYMIIYQIDEFAIFLAAVLTLRASKLEEKHGRILKLVGGTLMFSLALVMLIKPSLMNNLGSSLLIFAAAFGLTLLTLLVHRKILPRFGIYIGSENLFPRKRRRQRKARRPG